MGAFECQRCHGYCCTCQGCHPQTAADGTVGCSRCIPIYEQQLINAQSAVSVIQQYQHTNQPRNVFTDTYGQPQITYRRH